MDTKIKENIVEALETMSNRLGAIATVGEDGKPHVASVYFDFDKDLNIYFVTRASTQKYTNTLTNPAVAFLVSTEQPPKTVQIEGYVSEVTDLDEQKTHFQRIFEYAKSIYPEPPFAQMMSSEIMVMKLIPASARLGDFDSSRQSDIFKSV